MMKLALLTMLFCLPALADDGGASFGSVKEWKNAGFGNPVFSTLKSSAKFRGRPFSHSLQVMFVMFRHADWSEADVQKQFDWSVNTYAQCGIKLVDSPLVIVDAPDGKVSIEPNKDEVDDGNIARRIPTVYRPAIVLVKKNISFSDGYSYNENHPPRLQALIGTAYIDSVVLHSIIKLSYFNVIAHELAHILANAGHNGNEPPDILSAPIPHADYISEDQCDVMREYPAMRAL